MYVIKQQNGVPLIYSGPTKAAIFDGPGSTCPSRSFHPRDQCYVC
jgi:hypothetical protein